jgi:hypothetical protein
MFQVVIVNFMQDKGSCKPKVGNVRRDLSTTTSGIAIAVASSRLNVLG